MNNEEIVKRIQSGETELIGDLYLKNLGFIRKCVRHYSNDNNYEDLMQESYFGIVEAAKRWNPEKDVRFLSYASYYIRSVLLHYLRCNDKDVYLPSYLVEREKEYRSFVNDYIAKHGKQPSSYQIKLNTSLSSEQINEVKRALYISEKSVSIYDKVIKQAGDAEDLRLIDSIMDPDNGIDNLMNDIERKELSEKLWNIVDSLPEKESEIIRYRYKKGVSLKVCSKVFGLSSERIRQIEKHGLKRIRTAHKKELQPYIDDYVYQEGLKHTGLQEYRSTFESSVERAVIKLDNKLKQLDIT